MSSYPTIIDPQPTVESLTEAVRQLKMAVEQLNGAVGVGGAPQRFVQAEQPSNPGIGDVWADPTDAGRMRSWNGHFWVDVSSSRFTDLEAKYEDLSGTVSAAVARADLAYANSTEAAAQVKDTTESYFYANYASIEEEKTVRATADAVNATAITTLNATVVANNNTLTTAIQNEQAARVSGDAANASSISTLTSTVNGNTASISTLQSATATINGALSASWAVQGTIDGVTGGLRLTGLKKADGTGVTYNLIIDANVTINGGLLVNGSVTTNAPATNAFTEGTGSSGTWVAECDIVAKQAGDKFIIIGSYVGGAVSIGNAFGAGGGIAGNLNFDLNYNATPFATIAIRGFCYYVGLVYTGFGFVNQYYFMTAATTYMAVVTAGGPGNHHFRVWSSDATNLAQGVSIAAIRLSK